MKVTTIRKRPMAGRKLLGGRAPCQQLKEDGHRTVCSRRAIGVYARLDGLAQPVQQVLDLARLLPDGVQRALLRPVLGRPSEGARRGHAVATRASHLRHCSGRTVFGTGRSRRKRELKGEEAVRLAQLTLCVWRWNGRRTPRRERENGGPRGFAGPGVVCETTTAATRTPELRQTSSKKEGKQKGSRRGPQTSSASWTRTWNRRRVKFCCWAGKGGREARFVRCTGI